MTAILVKSLWLLTIINPSLFLHLNRFNKQPFLMGNIDHHSNLTFHPSNVIQKIYFGKIKYICILYYTYLIIWRLFRNKILPSALVQGILQV